MRTCIKCHVEKEESCFVSRTRNTCKDCRNARNKELFNTNLDSKAKKNAAQNKWVENNPDKVIASRQAWLETNPNYWEEYYAENSETKKSSAKEWRESNKDKSKLTKDIWVENNPNYQNNYQKDRLKSDLTFKLRKYASSYIRSAIKENDGSKQDYSILQFLSYTIEELKLHLESQFKPWMNWNNWGKYNSKTWNDNDSTTWTWQIDHIVPHSTFKYTSMEDDEFKRCWGLENLRPLSAKQNQLDGASKIRHKRGTHAM